MGLTLDTRQVTLDAFFDVPVYVGFSTTLPAHDGTNVTEPSGGGYARITTGASDWADATAADPAVVTNANALNGPTATADWAGGANLTHWVAYTVPTGGTPFLYGPLATAKAITLGDFPSLPAGSVTVSLDDGDA